MLQRNYFQDRNLRFVRGAALVALASCGCEHGHAAPANERSSAAHGELVSVKTVVVERRMVPDVLELTGTLEADEQSNVTPLVAGRVARAYVERGQRVKENEPLVSLRNVDYRTSEDSARAALQQARARLGIEGNAEASFDPKNNAEVRAADANRKLAEDAEQRAEKLEKTGAMSAADVEAARERAAASREQYDSALNATRSAWLALKNARLTLDQAERNLADSVVRAPFAGEVADRRVSVGEYVTPQQAVVTLVRIDPLRLELDVPQAEIGRVRAGQNVQVHVDAFPDREFIGTLRYVGASVQKQSRSLMVEAVVPNAESSLRPGMFVKTKILVGGERELAAVPKTAVLEFGGTRRAFVVADHHVEERVLAVVGNDGDTVLVDNGLKPSERVALGQLDRLLDGQEVKD